MLVALCALAAAGVEATAAHGAAREPSTRTPELTASWQAADDERIFLALAKTSGGFDGGEPADVHAMVTDLAATVQDVASTGVSDAEATSATVALAWYLGLPPHEQLSQHGSLVGEVAPYISALRSRVAAKKRALGLASQARSLLDEAEWMGTDKPGDEASLSAATKSARAAQTDSDLAAVLQQLQSLVAALSVEANSQLPQPLPTGPCLSGAPPKLIEVHLATQLLMAYLNGCPYFATYITSGRPALATDRGIFHIFYKARWFLMQSPWPYSSPYWYPNTWVGYAMEFVRDGTFLHTADWEPPAAFGKGSEYGPYASHGCVHVQDGPAAQLFAWAPVGTEVIVGD